MGPDEYRDNLALCIARVSSELSAMIQALGYEPKYSDISTLTEMAESGMSLVKAIKELGTSRATLSRFCDKNGIQLRSGRSTIDRDALERLSSEGVSIDEIQSRLGISSSSIYRLLGQSRSNDGRERSNTPKSAKLSPSPEAVERYLARMKGERSLYG